MKKIVNLSVQYKIFLIVTLVAFLAVLSLTTTFSSSLSKLLTNMVVTNELQKSKLHAELISSWLDERKKDVQIYTNTDILKYSSWERKLAYLREELTTRDEEYFFFFIADDKGNYSTTLQEDAGNIADRDYYPPVMAGKTIISNPIISRSTGYPIFVIAAPLFDESQQVTGLLAAVFQLDEFSGLVNGDSQENREIVSYIIDKNGLIMAHPDTNLILDKKIGDTNAQSSLSDIAPTIMIERSGLETYQDRGKENYIFYHEIEGTDGWKVMTQVPEGIILDSVRTTRQRLGLIGLLIIIIAAGLSYLVARNISQPIIHLKNVFNQGAEGDLSVRAPVESEDEIGQAANSFNKMMESLKLLTYNDSLTGLPNISFFKKRFEQVLKKQKETEQTFVCSIGIDDFESVNDSYGHPVGDRVLKILAERLKQHLNGMEIARISDEFYFYLQGSFSEEEIVSFSREILEHITQPYLIENYIITIRASLGIAIHTAGEDINSLVKKASLAMHSARNEHEKILIFSIDIEEELTERKKLETEMAYALENEEFVLHFQPFISCETGDVIGLEALIRWQHPEKGLIPPGKFIPFAEKTGMIVPIGEWVLYKACQYSRKLEDAGFTDINISVNVAPQQFQNPNFIPRLQEILKETGAKAENLELEITESVTIENLDYTINLLQVMRTLGLKIAIDDFGTGYSSLSYLKEFAINTLKIDKSFIDELLKDNASEAIVDTIINMGHNLNLVVVAEGVEEDQQVKLLSSKRCDLLQGYYFSRPQPADVMMDFVRERAEKR